MFAEFANSYLPSNDVLANQEYPNTGSDDWSYALDDETCRIWDDAPVTTSPDSQSSGSQEYPNTSVSHNPIPVVDGGGQALARSIPVMPIIPVGPTATPSLGNKKTRKRSYPKKGNVFGTSYQYQGSSRCDQVMAAYRHGYGQKLTGNRAPKFFRRASKAIGRPMESYCARYRGSSWLWVAQLDLLSYYRLLNYAYSGGRYS